MDVGGGDMMHGDAQGMRRVSCRGGAGADGKGGVMLVVLQEG